MNSKKIKFWRNAGIISLAIYLCFAGARWWIINKTWFGVAIAAQVVRDTFNATEQFIQRHHALPGDMRNAGNFLEGCTGVKRNNCNPYSQTAGNGIIGRPDFFETLKPQVYPQTNTPAKSEADETVLFWTHLALSGFSRTNSDGMTNGSNIVRGCLPLIGLSRFRIYCRLCK